MVEIATEPCTPLLLHNHVRPSCRQAMPLLLPPLQDGCCVPRPGAGCSCAFHASEGPRRIERIAERVRRDPGFMREAEAALGVFERQGR